MVLIHQELFSCPYLYVFISTYINPDPLLSSFHTLSSRLAGTASELLPFFLVWLFFQFIKQAVPLCQSLQGLAAAGKSQLSMLENCGHETPTREEALTFLYILNVDVHN